MNQSESAATRVEDAFVLSSLGWQHLFQDCAQEFQQAQVRAVAEWIEALTSMYHDAWQSWAAALPGGTHPLTRDHLHTLPSLAAAPLAPTTES
ncbi:hypothetical protein [Variovorax sp. Sphag1AA]|uniref:hypothetical protein n=1 Tax=Variovorax sp. Sphag1AA TaxID=2587027 RepID=UPI001622436E|nr:hypothetical protein [Variovorax sp. Sphag1AA]MBB3181957.1 hypothetical protein [Variovorax sp. Sphag1AA]